MTICIARDCQNSFETGRLELNEKSQILNVFDY